MPGPANLVASLQVEPSYYPTFNKQETLYLDLWKGFSASIKLIIRKLDEEAERDEANWYTFPHNVVDRRDEIHFARALSHGLLIVKDGNGEAVHFDHTADDDTWDHDDMLWLFSDPYEGEAWQIYLSEQTASSLRQFRKRLVPGLQYNLQLTPEAVKIPWGRWDWNHDEHISYEQRQDGLPHEISCDQSTINFRVLLGTETPCFTMSLTTTSSVCPMSSGAGFEICLRMTSMAKVPVMLGLMDGMWSRPNKLTATWSYNGIGGFSVQYLENSLGQVYEETFDRSRWGSDQFESANTNTMEIIPGSYRRHIEGSLDPDAPIAPLALPSPRAPSPRGLKANPWPIVREIPVEAVIMCPGDTLTQRIQAAQEDLTTLRSGHRHEIMLKTHICRFWNMLPILKSGNRPYG